MLHLSMATMLLRTNLNEQVYETLRERVLTATRARARS